MYLFIYYYYAKKETRSSFVVANSLSLKSRIYTGRSAKHTPNYNYEYIRECYVKVRQGYEDCPQVYERLFIKRTHIATGCHKSRDALMRDSSTFA